MKKQSGLKIQNIHVSVEEKEILHGVSFQVNPGTLHVVMGPNGSGKSTLSYALLGHPSYTVTGGTYETHGAHKSNQSRIIIDGTDVSEYPTHKRVQAGLFLAMQSPVAVPGVSVLTLLREAFQEIHKSEHGSPQNGKSENPVLARRFFVGSMSMTEFMRMVQGHAKRLGIPDSMLSRSIHDGFSGGERKKIEMLEALVLQPKYAIFDEIDTGLDVDALKTVAHGISILQKDMTGIIVITHYQRILRYLTPDVVHVLVNGSIVETGGPELVGYIDRDGYKKYAVKPNEQIALRIKK